jgi:hypothetical protein
MVRRGTSRPILPPPWRCQAEPPHGSLKAEVCCEAGLKRRWCGSTLLLNWGTVSHLKGGLPWLLCVTFDTASNIGPKQPSARHQVDWEVHKSDWLACAHTSLACTTIKLFVWAGNQNLWHNCFWRVELCKRKSPRFYLPTLERYDILCCSVFQVVLFWLKFYF